MTAEADGYTHLLYSVEDRIARITMNRPEKRNALNTVLRQEIVAALKAAERDDNVTVALIDGAGPAFCAGYDISPERTDRPAEYRSARWFDFVTDQVQRELLGTWMTIWDLLKPVVAKVHGACLAGGSELMSMCDIVFVADDARIGHPAARGMSTPDVPYFPWKLSMAQAKYLGLTGNSVTGRDAAAIGWVTKSFPSDELDAETMRECRALASIPPDMLAVNKLSLNQAYEMQGFRTALAAAAQWHTLSGPTVRPSGREFVKVLDEEGVGAALKRRDGGFHNEGFA